MVWGSTWKELGGHFSVLPKSEKLNRLKNRKLFLERTQENSLFPSLEKQVNRENFSLQEQKLKMVSTTGTSAGVGKTEL